MIIMGTITISVEDKTEQKFRHRAMLKYGKRKGSLGTAVTKAMECWLNSESKSAEAETMQYLEKGFNMGKLKYKTRDELHER